MKTSNVLATVLFSTMALAAPLDRRAYVTKTEVKMEYYTVYTTVTGGQPAATPDPALFYEDKPESPTAAPTVVAPEPTKEVPTDVASEPTEEVPAVVEPTSEKKPEPTTSSTSVYTPPPAEPTAPPPAPTASTQAAPPPPKPSVVAEPEPEPKPEPTQSSGGSGEVHSGGSYTMNPYDGTAAGACGDPIQRSDMAVALAVDTFGTATVDYMTGKTTNPWCNKKIEVTYEGKTAIAYIKDRCSGCTNGGLDATPALWEATTGGIGGDNGDRLDKMTWRVVE